MEGDRNDTSKSLVEKKVAFQQKKPVTVEEPQVVDGKISFKQKEPARIEEAPVVKEKVDFKHKEMARFEEKSSQDEMTVLKSQEEPLSVTIKKEYPKEVKESKVQTATGETVYSAKKTPNQKEKGTFGRFLRRKSYSSSTQEKSKFGRLFSSYILNGIVLCAFTIGATFILSSIKNSPSNSIMWKMCFVPQLFLVYIVILLIMYVASVAMVFMGIHKKFK